MTIEEIKASGLLELYALGQLSAREHELVREYLDSFPALRKDLHQIEQALENVAQAASVKAPSAVKQRILDEVNRNSSSTEHAPTQKSMKTTGWIVVAALLSIIALGLLYLFTQKDRELKDTRQRLDVVIDSCSRESEVYLAHIDNLRQLTLEDNEILHMIGTGKYPQTDLYFHHNPVTKRNFIQIRNLPALAANQSFQLWSLKPDIAPIPLDVFQRTGDQVIEVHHIVATQSYAITIEPLGGQNSPTLENLIGIVNVGS